MERGVVKWFNEEKGYGLIAPEQGGEDIFVHHTYIEGLNYPTLLDGQRVEFEAMPKNKRLSAIRVRVV